MRTKSEIRTESLRMIEDEKLKGTGIVEIGSPLWFNVIEFILAPKERKPKLRCYSCHGVVSYSGRFCKNCGKQLFAGLNQHNSRYMG